MNLGEECKNDNMDKSGNFSCSNSTQIAEYESNDENIMWFGEECNN